MEDEQAGQDEQAGAMEPKKPQDYKAEDVAGQLSQPYNARIEEARTVLFLNESGEIVASGFLESCNNQDLTKVQSEKLSGKPEKVTVCSYIQNRQEIDVTISQILKNYSPTYQSMGDMIGDLVALEDRKILLIIKSFKKKFFKAFELDHKEVMGESEANPANQ